MQANFVRVSYSYIGGLFITVWAILTDLELLYKFAILTCAGRWMRAARVTQNFVDVITGR